MKQLLLLEWNILLVLTAAFDSRIIAVELYSLLHIPQEFPIPSPQREREREKEIKGENLRIHHLISMFLAFSAYLAFHLSSHDSPSISKFLYSFTFFSHFPPRR